jgi:hypothetical protein
MGCTKSGLSKAFLVLISRGMADHGEQAGGFSGEQQRGQEFFFLSCGDFLASRSFSIFKAVDSSAKHSLSPYMHYIEF